MQNILRLIFSVLILLTGSGLASAQMFSVAEAPQRFTFSNTYVRIGTSITDFSYVGNVIATGGTERLELSAPVLAFHFENRSISASAIVGNDFLGLSNQAFFDLNLKLSNGIPIVRQQRLQAGIPIELSTGLTTADSDDTNERFSQTTLAAGLGAFLNTNLSRRVRFEVQGISGYGFSNSNGGFFGGSVFYVNGQARVNFLNVIRGRALSIGYDYNFKSFDIDEDRFDFDLNAHQITLGISL